jgi:hypothetical protein
MHSQQETWAQHAMVRNFWGFTEKDDFNRNCSRMNVTESQNYVKSCKAHRGWDVSTRHFVVSGYGFSEGVYRGDDAGWICAQRRMGRALGWLQHVYTTGGLRLPDYLLLVVSSVMWRAETAFLRSLTLFILIFL